jgi:hypothetical protein
MPTQGGSFTNHPGVVDFMGGSYFFYHNGALPGGGGYTRSVAVEKFTYRTDNTIPTINMTTTGAPQVGTLNPYVRQEAETIAWESGVETGVASEGGMNVGYIENGDYIKVKGVAFGAGATAFNARVASATSGGKIEVHLDSVSGPLVGTCNVPGTGGWQTWTTVSCPVTNATATHDVFFRFTGGSGSLFNVNWWQFTGLGLFTTAPPTTVAPTTPVATSAAPTSAAPTSAAPTSAAPTSAAPTSAAPTSAARTSPPPAGACSASFRTVGSWQGGFQGEVTVTAGSSAITGWTARWTLASGQAITQLWSGTLSTSGSAVSVSNVDYNKSLAASASATFGFLANGTPSTPSITCTSP